jgi:hypothetical protein
MEKNLLFQLSQTHLQLLETCPRKFQYGVMERFNLPQISSLSEPQELGLQFHQLIQQRDLGLDIQPLLSENPKIQQWFERLQDAPPPLISGLRQSEHQRTMTLDKFVLVAVYDLLIQSQNQAQIIDWKTYRRPPQPQMLQQRWQTRLYPFILVETSDYLPEQISMGYWFTETIQNQGASSHWITLPYSTELHEQTRQTLKMMLHQLHQLMAAFAADRRDFPQVPLAAGQCRTETHCCPFVRHCQRDASSKQPDLTDLTAIAEIALG